MLLSPSISPQTWWQTHTQTDNPSGSVKNIIPFFKGIVSKVTSLVTSFYQSLHGFSTHMPNQRNKGGKYIWLNYVLLQLSENTCSILLFFSKVFVNSMTALDTWISFFCCHNQYIIISLSLKGDNLMVDCLTINGKLRLYSILKHVSIVFGRTLFSNNVRATKAAETKNGDYFWRLFWHQLTPQQ